MWRQPRKLLLRCARLWLAPHCMQGALLLGRQLFCRGHGCICRCAHISVSRIPDAAKCTGLQTLLNRDLRHGP